MWFVAPPVGSEDAGGSSPGLRAVRAPKNPPTLLQGKTQLSAMTNRSALRNMLMDYLGLALVLGGMIVFFGLSTENFLTPRTFTTIANQIPVALVLAVGMTLVLIIGGIDLSVGSILGLSAAVLGVALRGGWPLPLAMAACLLTGLACGAVNGLIVVGWRLPSFIVTLGMLEAARGGEGLVNGQQTLYFTGAPLKWLGASAGNLSVAFLIALGVALFAQLVLARTVFGRYLVAIGTNEEVVRLSGIKTWPVKLTVFALSGLLAALAAIMDCARSSSAIAEAGKNYELPAIAAVVIGGTSLMGGRGSVLNSVIGVLLIAVLAAGLSAMSVRDPIKQVTTGVVIVVAVILDRYRHRAAGASK